MKITRPLFVPLFVTAASVVATCALAGGAWAAVHTDGIEPTATPVPALVAGVDDGTQPGVEGTGAWIDEYEMTALDENDGTQPGVEGTGAWIDEYEVTAADENDGTQPGVEGTGAWIDVYEDGSTSADQLIPGVNDGTQPGVEGTGAWIDVYEN